MFFPKQNNAPVFYSKDREKASWRCPGFLEHEEMLFLLDDLCKEVGIKQPIQSVFGCITTPWGGGRVPSFDEIDEKKLVKIIENYNSRNIFCHFTFSNYRVKKEHLDDRTGNLLCKVASQISDKNGIIVSSDLLSDYIRDKYPNLKQTSSLLKPTYEHPRYDETAEYYNELCNKFDTVVVRADFYDNLKMMKQLKDKSKIELIVNQNCFKFCELARTHYDRSVKYSAEDKDAKQRTHFCHKKMNDIKNYSESLTLANSEIDDFIKLGFTHFKLAGRAGRAKTVLTEIIGRYIFEPSGHFCHLQRYIVDKLNLT